MIDPARSDDSPQLADEHGRLKRRLLLGDAVLLACIVLWFLVRSRTGLETGPLHGAFGAMLIAWSGIARRLLKEPLEADRPHAPVDWRGWLACLICAAAAVALTASYFLLPPTTEMPSAFLDGLVITNMLVAALALWACRRMLGRAASRPYAWSLFLIFLALTITTSCVMLLIVPSAMAQARTSIDAAAADVLAIYRSWKP